MPDGVLSDTLHLTVTSAGAVQSWLFIKEISWSFFFSPILMNSRPFPPLFTNELPSEV